MNGHVQEAMDQLDAPTGPQLPIEIDPSVCKPPRGYVMVRCDAATGMSGGLLVCYERAAATFFGEVVAVGEDVEVEVGDRVIVESMSGHACMTSPLIDAEGNLLSIVPCRRPDEVQRQDEEHALRQIRLSALEKVFGGMKNKMIPPKALIEIRDLRAWVAWAKAMRRTKSRSRLFKPLHDPARGQGVLAVVEDEA